MISYFGVWYLYGIYRNINIILFSTEYSKLQISSPIRVYETLNTLLILYKKRLSYFSNNKLLFIAHFD